MPAELMLNFPDPTQVTVHLLDEYADMTSAFAFVNPLTNKDMEEIRWYLEEYGTGYRAEPDDERADRVREQLPRWGTALFDAVFKADDKAYELFRNFRDEEEKGRLLTIAADHPAVLSLPWELLRSSGGVFLFGETPRISIRQRLPMAGQGRRPHKRKSKPVLRLLFIVSRPEDAGFINPRTDPQAVLDALEQQEQRRVEVEFLRPATLTALQERLRDEDQPAVDIIHFDGHGVFDRSGGLGKEAAKTYIPQYMKELLLEAESKGETTAAPKHTGYLLFEDDQGKKALVEARILGELFHRQRIGLVVLSACQSAAMDAEDAMSSVAAWLTHAGIPGVLAMTHKVLVATAGLLFARFYSSLFRGEPVGKALDDARAALYFDPKRGERRRSAGGNQSVTLELHDWFLPALYQTGPNRPLLSREDGSEVPAPDRKHNLPKMQESGFFGRTRELWRIERALTVQGTRRFSVTGFGGQGKTYLALEAGYWLLRTGLFQRVCFVSFAGFQGIDPVGVTISTLATVLDESLPDAEAAEAALKRIPTLLILDNLETLADGAGLPELLTAATRWSEAGDSRVLLTSRQPDFNHPDYRTAGTFEHQCLHLKGLGEQDALDWFGELMRLPPEPKFGMPQRSALVTLFQQVDFHPLSIGLLAQQLKERRPAELGERLEALLEEQPADREDRTLLASLELSIERLPERCREWLPRLGVFAGGCLEAAVRDITGFDEAHWQELRNHLLQVGLMEAEQVPNTGNTFLRFHPTLSPALWQKLSKEEQVALMECYCQAYHQLSGELYRLDNTNPYAARLLARREMLNLLFAAQNALDTKHVDAVTFAIVVNTFLNYFGMINKAILLDRKAEQQIGERGSDAWFMAQSNQGEKLFASGQPEKAAEVFNEILLTLGDDPTYNRAMILTKLGRCSRAAGHIYLAEAQLRVAFNVTDQLKQNELVKGQRAWVHCELADVLTTQGRFTEAREEYKQSRRWYKEVGNLRGQVIVKIQVGTLSLQEKYIAEAIQCYEQAFELAQDLQEPALNATIQHQLGIALQDDEQWYQADDHYRQAAYLYEQQGSLALAAQTWNQLAVVNAQTGKLQAAEGWCRKAIKGGKQTGDLLATSRAKSNLAAILHEHPDRLAEARKLAEEALAIDEKVDPAAAEIWKIYTLLAQTGP
ncbi:CHAT domain-containing protein [Candidatus Electrothrix sp.]|uniref:CHAT domain-containing protein n=1 Tax=Candidatus Electrothrix sp. TaxID=2170559 RepID=UPI0040566064